MKIGIIVHSQTGHTLFVGEKLREKLRSDGHEVALIRFQNVETPKGPQKIEDVRLDHIPDAAGYDALIFGTWVEAFNLSHGFTLYVQQIPDLDVDNVSCFLTQQFRYKWMGGTLAMSKMKRLLRAKGAKINATGIINWSNKKREQQIDDLVSRFSSQYQV